MYGPSVTWPPHGRDKCLNVPDASRREMERQPLVCRTLGASWRCHVSMKMCVLFVCLCVGAHLSGTHVWGVALCGSMLSGQDS